MFLILSILMSAAVLGIIIMVMEGGEFPGWWKMVACVLAAAIPQAIAEAILPGELFFIPPLVGAVCAMFAIMATCGMEMKRSAIAAGIYLAVRFVFSLAAHFVFST